MQVFAYQELLQECRTPHQNHFGMKAFWSRPWASGAFLYQINPAQIQQVQLRIVQSTVVYAIHGMDWLLIWLAILAPIDLIECLRNLRFQLKN